jgi:hypothetical protein
VISRSGDVSIARAPGRAQFSGKRLDEFSQDSSSRRGRVLSFTARDSFVLVDAYLIRYNRGMKQPYSFELQTEYPEVFASIKLPVAVITVTVNGEFCCNAGISSEGVLDLLLPEETYRNLRADQAKMLFPIFKHSPGERGQLFAIEIDDVSEKRNRNKPVS